MRSTVDSALLIIQQQTWCSSNFACPTDPQSSQLEWVAEYFQSSHFIRIVGPFKPGSKSLSQKLRVQIDFAARVIQYFGPPGVSIAAFGDSQISMPANILLSKDRVTSAKRYLARRFRFLGVSGVVIDTKVWRVVDGLTSNYSNSRSFGVDVIVVN